MSIRNRCCIRMCNNQNSLMKSSHNVMCDSNINNMTK